MAELNANATEAPGLIGMQLPKEGNVKVDATKPLGSEHIPGSENMSDAEKLQLAEKAIADREAKLKLEKGTPPPGTKEGEQKIELTDEEINSKLDEIEKKDQTTLTDEEKAFIEAHTEVELDEITSVKQDMETTYGIKLDGEFQNSPDGLKLLASEMAPKIGEQMLLNYLSQVPYMREFFDHVVIGGKSLETFLVKNEKPIFTSIEIKPLADVEEASKPKMIDNLKTLLKMDLTNKGNNEDDIVQLIQLYEANGSLYDKAKLAKESLTKAHTAQVDAKIKEEEAKIQAQEQRVQEEFKQVDEMITKNDIAGIQIPAADIRAFKDAMLRGLDAQGRTLMDSKRDKMTLAQRVLIDYLIFKDLKVNGLQSKVPAQSKSFSFKKANEENNKRMGNRIRKSGTGAENKGITEGNPNFDIKQFTIERQTVN